MSDNNAEESGSPRNSANIGNGNKQNNEISNQSYTDQLNDMFKSGKLTLRKTFREPKVKRRNLFGYFCIKYLNLSTQFFVQNISEG